MTGFFQCNNFQKEKDMKRFGILAAMLAVAVAFSDAQAGRVPTPGSDFTFAAPYGKVTYHETFRGGELAMVQINGDGSSDLDLYVYDQNGNLVAYAIGLSDQEIVTFRPIWTGTFRIEVRNLGGRTNWFRMSTN